MPILLIDNFDSFTFNLVAILKFMNCDVQVIRNNDILSYKKLINKSSKIIISPGPSHPANSCLSLDAIDYSMHYEIPLLGVCLGHQAIGYYFGAIVKAAPKPIHGKISEIICDNNNALWNDIPSSFLVTRYHSLIIDSNLLPQNLEILAQTKKDQLIMAIKHKQKPIYGLQFHPESICTEYGEKMLGNFIWTC